MDGGHPVKGGDEDPDRVGPWRNFKNPYPESNNPNLPQKNLVTLSRDELRVLHECNRESFWYRSLPASMIFIGLTQFAVNKGYLKPHPKFGATLKNIGAGLAGYILGKLSYQNECRKKILSLPNSKLAETLRQRFSGGSQPTTEFVPEVPMDTTLTTSDTKIFEDSNVFQSKAEPKEPLPTFSLGDQSQDAQNQEYKSYEDLRRQNRKSYTEGQYSRWTKQTKPPSSPPPSVPESRQEQDSIPIRVPRSSSNMPVKSKNEYGDVWEEE
ncbi:Hypothetical predicted protein [Octopus vulgaris]|uniref:Uncharacterized protein n=2 Tax=Octopus TaxID=6643 RepID=A0AA36FDT9_OCTVU|nr:OCIA domain-containing protein 1 isoform X1 [Octopus sinensis]CAI9734615.1 Hypothetical predicted protein [Octopus vulgaris]